MTDLAVRAQQLGKQYHFYERPADRVRELFSFRRTDRRGFWALQEFDFEVKKGESIGIVGVNGAGKSTLLKLLAGKLRPTTGAIDMHGRVSSILELGTGFQPHLTGRQNARVNALFLGLRPWELERHVESIIAFAEIGEHADQPLLTYSSGMQARLAFAALTTLNPEILILDEALATGDAKFAAKCNDYLRKLCRSGCTTLLASHDFWFLANTCDRIVWIDKGRKRAEGEPTEILQQYLEALGQNATAAVERPVHVLLKVEASEPATQPTFMINALQWQDADGHVVGEHHLGDQRTWNQLVELAPQCGFTIEGARAGWGKAEMIRESLNRPCQPASAPGGAAFLTLPVPPPPRPIPTRLQVTLRREEPCDAVFSLLVDGRWQELGRAGKAGPGLDWARAVFDLGGAFQAAPPVAAAGGAA